MIDDLVFLEHTTEHISNLLKLFQKEKKIKEYRFLLFMIALMPWIYSFHLLNTLMYEIDKF